MHNKVSFAPKGFRTVTPVLTVAGAAGAIDFYAHVFGAEERARVYGVDGLSISHCELKIGNSVLIVCDHNPALGIHGPAPLGASPVIVHLYFDDVDEVWERAIEAGATPVVPLADAYWGERYGKFIDPYGHVWSLAKRVEELSADEIASRAAALYAPAAPEPEQALAASDEVLAQTIAAVPVADATSATA